MPGVYMVTEEQKAVNREQKHVHPNGDGDGSLGYHERIQIRLSLRTHLSLLAKDEKRKLSGRSHQPEPLEQFLKPR